MASPASYAVRKFHNNLTNILEIFGTTPDAPTSDNTSMLMLGSLVTCQLSVTAGRASSASMSMLYQRDILL